MPTRDKKRIEIDVWARWRIVNPMKYFQAVRTEQRGYKILDDLVDSAVRDVIARYDLIEAVRSTDRQLRYENEELADVAAATVPPISVGRARMEGEIRDIASADIETTYGMELLDVRIKRINYIESVRQSIFERMKSERMRIASLFQSEAEEEKNRILGITHKELEQIEGEMQQKSVEIRGEADAEVTRTLAEALRKSPEFYEFTRRLEAYRKTLGDKTTLILSTGNDFLTGLGSAPPPNDAP